MDKKFYFSWNNLSAWYTEKQGGKYRKKVILDGVSGTVFSKSLVAIMGASGVGKTTFLASLAGKNRDKTGLVLFNDCVLEENYLNTISNYVYQKDITIESLTVMEQMMFMSYFKLHKSPREGAVIVESILKDLNLDQCKDTLLKHLSGGERKRVSLAVELINDPLILFCDEPTTGLDSCNALGIVQKLRDRVVSEKLVMVTIHQPSSQLFEYFTHVILLTNGDIFYNGAKDGVAVYFQSLNLHCPINYNPAEFYIKCISIDAKNRIKTHHRNNLYIKDVTHKEKIVGYKYNKNNSFDSLYWLLWRIYLDTKRNFGYHSFQTCLLLATASMLALFYSTMEDGDEHLVQNTKGILYFCTSELIFIHTYNVINTFSEEYSVFLREKPLYSTHIYFLSKFLAIIPRNFIQPFLFLSINFSLVRFLRGFDVFLEVYAIMICACVSGSLLGLCISAFFTSLEYMDLFIAPFELITMLAAGILINVRSSIFFSWIKYLSPFYYTYESLSIVHWSNIDGLALMCNNRSEICYRNGKEVLEELGFYTEPIHVLWNMIYMTVLSIAVALATYLALFYKRKMHFSY